MTTERREELRRALAGIRREPAAFPEAPLASYEDALYQWCMQRCVFRDRCWGGVKALHHDYFLWCTEDAREVPCSLALYTEWLRGEGFYLNGSGLVAGLIMKADLEAAGISYA